MGEVEPALEKAGFIVSRTSYGQYPIWSFLFHWKSLEQKAIRRLTDDITDAVTLHGPDLISVIAHSFGTYVISKILLSRAEFRWERIIFCGSVVRDDFPFRDVVGRFTPPLLNEVGDSDIWPAFAEKFGYGAVGSYGFNRPAVQTRWHKGFRHSDFLNEKFCNENWIPFLLGKGIASGDKPSLLSWYRRPTLIIATVLLAFITVGICVVTFELNLRDRRIAQIQKTLCVGNSGNFDEPTQEAVRGFLVGADLRSTSDTRPITESSLTPGALALIDRTLPKVEDCREMGFRSAFEVGRFAAGSEAENRQRVIGLQQTLGVQVTGKIDPSTREAIQRFRRKERLSPNLGDQIDEELLRRLFQ
jgi:pimeloyl-ACP methyl ester carboxylesterase